MSHESIEHDVVELGCWKRELLRPFGMTVLIRSVFDEWHKLADPCAC